VTSALLAQPAPAGPVPQAVVPHALAFGIAPAGWLYLNSETASMLGTGLGGELRARGLPFPVPLELGLDAGAYWHVVKSNSIALTAFGSIPWFVTVSWRWCDGPFLLAPGLGLGGMVTVCVINGKSATGLDAAFRPFVETGVALGPLEILLVPAYTGILENLRGGLWMHGLSLALACQLRL